MPSTTNIEVFLVAALVLAVSPGPGLLYVLARSLQGGRRVGVVSSIGTSVGGFCHVVAAAFGLSAVLATSAAAFSAVRYAGAAYLLYLGIRTLLTRVDPHPDDPDGPERAGSAFQQGIVTEVLNPKTALFFLAFLPQFINREANAVPQFILLGGISVLLNSGMDVLVALLAAPLGHRLRRSARLRTGQRLASGGVLVGLGAYVALSGGKQ